MLRMGPDGREPGEALLWRNIADTDAEDGKDLADRSLERRRRRERQPVSWSDRIEIR
jgi:hypothetical protein